MTEEQTQLQIKTATLKVLSKSGLTAQDGVSALMSSTLDVLGAVARLTGNKPDEFIKNVLMQTLSQI